MENFDDNEINLPHSLLLTHSNISNGYMKLKYKY